MDKVIKCCVCGQEYLPAEIFIPDEFFGNPGEIIKNDAGQIEFFLGSNMNTEEEYICDNCGSKLKVKATISFETEVDAEESDEEYVSNFNKPKKLQLTEEELF